MSTWDFGACLHYGLVMWFFMMLCLCQGSYLEIKKQMDKLDPLAHPLLHW